MTTIVYNIPANLVPPYRGQAVIVRAEHPTELLKAFSRRVPEHLVGIQLLSLTVEIDLLGEWGAGIPIELVMFDPGLEFPLLYRSAKLLDKHPVRVSIPVILGFSKAVKVATSLQYVVKLELGQPEPALIGELSEVLSSYLHQPLISQPIEPFHSLLISFYYADRATLWDIQEEDPAYFHYITKIGRQTIPRRFGGGRVTGNLGSFVTDFKRDLLAEAAECGSCEFFERCGGYFKWPRRDFSCDGVKALFRTLKEASEELRYNMTALNTAEDTLR
jgi:hypothetical protein